MSCFCRNRDTTSGPKVKETPLSFSDHPVMSLSGSDHSRSQRSPEQYISSVTLHGAGQRHRGERYGVNVPVSGTSVGRMTLRICSIDWRSGDSPPCIVKIFSSIMAAMGRQLKQSVKVFHSLMLYRRLPKRDAYVPGGSGPDRVSFSYEWSWHISGNVHSS